MQVLIMLSAGLFQMWVLLFRFNYEVILRDTGIAHVTLIFILLDYFMAHVYVCHLLKNSASLFAHISGMQIKAILREELLVV